jgi:hypothetical protein
MLEQLVAEYPQGARFGLRGLQGRHVQPVVQILTETPALTSSSRSV